MLCGSQAPTISPGPGRTAGVEHSALPRRPAVLPGTRAACLQLTVTTGLLMNLRWAAREVIGNAPGSVTGGGRMRYAGSSRALSSGLGHGRRRMPWHRRRQVGRRHRRRPSSSSQGRCCLPGRLLSHSPTSETTSGRLRRPSSRRARRSFTPVLLPQDQEGIQSRLSRVLAVCSPKSPAMALTGARTVRGEPSEQVNGQVT